MSESAVPAPVPAAADVDGVIQSVRFELYRENIYGALEIVEAAHAARPDPRYAEQAARIRSWLGHLQSREAYVAAQERQYKGLRWKMGLKLLEKRIRMLSGKKTRKMIERRGRDPEFQELEREVDAVKPRRVLDAGSGEGGVAMALCARHPELTVDGVEVSFTNVRIARKLNRCKTASFRQGLAEEVHEYFETGRGSVRIQAQTDIEDIKGNRQAIIVATKVRGRHACARCASKLGLRRAR
jgi:SAM-dependent methyltransferase